MKFIDKETLELDKILNELDLLVLDFIRILEKHALYVIVSGYVAILLGRTRGTEDIDIFIESLDKGKFRALYLDLKEKGYWCLNTKSVDEMYEYLQEGSAIRFARENEIIPNFEVKRAMKAMDREALNDVLLVKTKKGDLRISSLERQIAFKRHYLKSEKDLEDAAHIEGIFKNSIDIKKIEKYKRMLENEKA